MGGQPLPLLPEAGGEEETYEMKVTADILKNCKQGEDMFGIKGSKVFFKDPHGRVCKLFIKEAGLTPGTTFVLANLPPEGAGKKLLGAAIFLAELVLTDDIPDENGDYQKP